MSQITEADRRRGCLVGGAIGDALGAPIEFSTLADIRAASGPRGVTDLTERLITDDTQMTMFTAEGLIRALARFLERGICDPKTVVWRAYQRWLATQGEPTTEELDGWLYPHRELHHRRAPGTTCLAALRSPDMGRIKSPINHSKGCGGVMRAAPVGLFTPEPFYLACEIAATTHGHPTGYLAAGAFAVMIARLYQGGTLEDAIDAAMTELARHRGHVETSTAITKALHAAEHMPTEPETIETLGKGWVAEEALAIAVYCALKADDFASGVLLAVNHSGDSDSTGSMTGNLLGVRDGEEAIPSDWHVELEDVIRELADDMGVVQTFSSSGFGANEVTHEFWKKYPGY